MPPLCPGHGGAAQLAAATHNTATYTAPATPPNVLMWEGALSDADRAGTAGNVPPEALEEGGGLRKSGPGFVLFRAEATIHPSFESAHVTARVLDALCRNAARVAAFGEAGLPRWCPAVTRLCPFLLPLAARREYGEGSYGHPPHGRCDVPQPEALQAPTPPRRGGAVPSAARTVRVDRQREGRGDGPHAADALAATAWRRGGVDVQYTGEEGTGLGPTLDVQYTGEEGTGLGPTLDVQYTGEEGTGLGPTLDVQYTRGEGTGLGPTLDVQYTGEEGTGLGPTLDVQYTGEEGTGLGPTLEFYTLASRELRRRRHAMWHRSMGRGTADPPSLIRVRGGQPAAALFRTAAAQCQCDDGISACHAGTQGSGFYDVGEKELPFKCVKCQASWFDNVKAGTTPCACDTPITGGSMEVEKGGNNQDTIECPCCSGLNIETVWHPTEYRLEFKTKAGSTTTIADYGDAMACSTFQTTSNDHGSRRITWNLGSGGDDDNFPYKNCEHAANK
eukprot:gene17100-15165_t